MQDKKVVILPSNSELSEETVHALDELFGSITPQEIQHSIQELIYFILINIDPEWYPNNFKEIMTRVYFLDQFLTTANEKNKSNENSDV
ncbi:hypothetical protein [Flavobacterium sp.]|uniref:hypothetical protein n=1 Tax=Flavobacterium sp. TaxID=239 RepID=UPI0025C65907|nr:hypothetical protein [Flavobacterium sp.]